MKKEEEEKRRKRKKKKKKIVLALLSAHIKRFSVSLMHDFFLSYAYMLKVVTNIERIKIMFGPNEHRYFFPVMASLTAHLDLLNTLQHFSRLIELLLFKAGPWGFAKLRSALSSTHFEVKVGTSS